MNNGKIDVICPILYVDHSNFEDCLRSWIREIDIRFLIIGIAKHDNKLMDTLNTYLDEVPILILNQTNLISLGYCMRVLMSLVSSGYFLFLHADVELPHGWFNRMWDKRIRGIIESLKHPLCKSAAQQAKRERAYSGAQLIYKPAIWDKVSEWEDDYIYSSEDLLIQNYVLQNGFRYEKAPIYHRHYRTLARGQTKEELLDNQWKAIVKYGVPCKELVSYIKKPVNILKRKYGINRNLKKFVLETNPKWGPYL